MYRGNVKLTDKLCWPWWVACGRKLADLVWSGKAGYGVWSGLAKSYADDLDPRGSLV